MLDFGFYNMDCMDGMKEFPDKFFDLAIVDPPYGINIKSMGFTHGPLSSNNTKAKRKDYRMMANWNVKPGQDYFDELFRVSKKQIIWGGNYFSDCLPPSKSFIVWDKRLDEKFSNDFADCELAWCSNGLGVARVFRFMYNGMFQQNMKEKEFRIHPTQKPAALYMWILEKYSKPGDVILDTYAGSASSLVACHRTNHKYVGFEIDKGYYEKAKQRLDNETAQHNIFEYMNEPEGE